MALINRGISKDEIYSTNRAIVLRSIHALEEAGQKDIVNATGLKQPTVSKIVRDLSENGILDKRNKKDKDAKGRPSEYFSLNADLFSLAIRLARNVVASAFVGLEGKIYEKKDYSTAGIDSAGDLHKLLEKVIESRLSSRHIQEKTMVGVGIAVPGPVNVSESKIELVTDKRGWSGINISDLQSLTKLPVVVEQDADGAGVGEHIFGVARKYRRVIFIAAGRGIGAGILIDGSIVRGGQGLSGEFGHTSVKVDGLPCSCGNKGCVERYSSINSLLKYLKEQSLNREAISNPSDCTFDEVIELTKTGNHVVADAVRRSAYYLGVGVSNLVNLLAPTLIVLGDEMVKLGSVWIDKVKKTIKERSIRSYYNNLKIVVSDSGDDAFLEGAGALAFERFLKNPTYIMEPRER